MNKYTIRLLSSSMDMEEEKYCAIGRESADIEKQFTFQQFLEWFKGMRGIFDYSEDYFHFIPVDGGTEMFRKGDSLTKVTKQEFNSALLSITMFQGD